ACLTHAISDALATAKDQLVTVGGQILFDFNYQVSISKPDGIANSWPEQVDVALALNLKHLCIPSFWPLILRQPSLWRAHRSRVRKTQTIFFFQHIRSAR